MKWPLAIIAGSFLHGAGLADDFYVDVTHGDNSNAGTSTSEAWRTITHSMEQIPLVGAHTLHVLPGTYSVGTGEIFPIVMDHQTVEIIGVNGSCETTIENSGFLGTLVFIGENVGVRSITIRAGWSAILASLPGPGYVDIERVVLEAGGTALSVGQGNSGGPSIPAEVQVQVTDSAIQGGLGLQSTTDYDFGLNDTLTAIVRRTSISGAGAYVTVAGRNNRVSASFEACRIEGSTLNGVTAERTGQGSATDVSIRDSVVAGHAADGIHCAHSGSTLTIERSTIASNAASGIRQASSQSSTAIEASIVFANGDDLQIGGTLNLSNSNIGDGDQEGANGNISVDPLFRGPEEGDFRLGFATGCVDAIIGASGSDQAGFARGNDGNLDLIPAGDMGAYELRTLSAADTASIGKKLGIEIHAEPGTFTALWLARAAQLPIPNSTPFGDQWIPTPSELVAQRKVLSTNPIEYTVYVPNLPALIGRPFTFQALSRSSTAPAGAAWTDAVTVTLTP
ncbi:MAG: DUF1565 domain-containing protein [bacterium]|nr:DUF1565 domain-containing protein [bacterium]